jgi:hypothetical protein
MKLYCNIEKTINEQGKEGIAIKEGPRELPQNSSTISNLNLLDDKTLKKFGWVPVIQQTENKPVFVSVSYEVFDDKVIETTITRDKTEQELIEEKEKVDFYALQELRHHRNILLAESDKLVMIDRWEKLPVEEKQKLIEYRQALRDLPNQTSNTISLEFPTL